jgi:osmotically-inducible protein OsmY
MKLAPFLLSGVLLLGAVACSNETAKTSTDAPNSTQEAPKTPDAQAVKDQQNDAQSELRRKQLNADIKAHEERNNAMNGGKANRTDSALASEVRDKLEANIPESQLTVTAKNGAVTVAGTVIHPKNLQKIALAQQIKGVKSVTNKVTVAQPKGDNKKAQ